ncbi:UDP-2,4-diacetamido-2,4,6-trideoxy-beta-L-altropyranose hydrolase [Hydrogenovibrio sp. SC-1]|uniref:UDP-2,4-diacetamido-2,4, 6-trideoxy-beta-L-altropyranose hydrolase n=1 Tax=Hydrogenovibrio sp. SC-1 TaxID=2065820 RepID=UPI000C79BAEA|nr:UDP-2,4-diacetamido-2,4,6-trideoxy-beta-L-altropyranose hydrolase [Hydrogenovibrio sp. SC-1]PLA74889.1 UDP-2,4-diacetamido-2,4,6-trideoxy-beta-L-altropyranose hydrolase [Hydrogenovibrio sp. SC-1]
MKVVFRTDASIQIGTGHVMRCMTLAKALSEKGAEVQFICRNHIGNLIEKIQNEGFKVYTLNTSYDEVLCHSVQGESMKSLPCGAEQLCHYFQTNESPVPKLSHSDWLGATQQEDAIECHSILQQIHPDWLVVDHYSIDASWQKILKNLYRKLMVIDDLGDRRHISDLLLDQNYGSTVDKYQKLVPKNCKILAGAQYALLRPEFAKWRHFSLERRKNNQKVKGILITLGGVDSGNITGQVLQQLSKAELDSGIEVTIVMGLTSPHLKAIEQQAESLNFKTSVRINVNNIAELMANADLAIGAAGATTWERCCLGVPTIQLVIAENQRQVAERLAIDGVVKSIYQPKELVSLLSTALDWMPSLGQIASGVCDGHGCDRVINTMCS